MADVIDVTEFGAVGDGRTKDTGAIEKAIAACVARGGGQVRFPAGTYLTGPIRLASHVELHVEEGTTVLFSRDYGDYPLVVTDYEGEKAVRCLSPLWGEELRNVAITGKGSFDGQGEVWRPVKKMKLSASEWADLVASGGVVDEARGIWWPTRAAMEGEEAVQRLRAGEGTPRVEDYHAVRDFLRPNLLKLSGCRGVLLDGPTFRNSPAWNLHLLLCEEVTVRNVTVLNPWYAQNGDGLDLDSCRGVLVEDSVFDVGDDAICLKSGRDEEGRRRGRPTEDVTIRACRVLHGHGGVTIGSEMSGGVRNIDVSDCVFQGTDVGLRFKTRRGRGGVVEDIRIRDITMKDIRGAAISMDMFYGNKEWGVGSVSRVETHPVGEGTPRFRDIHIQGVTCHGARRSIELRGLPEMPIEAITFEGLRLIAEEGASLMECDGVTLRDVHLESRSVPALQCHNVRNLTLERVDGTDERSGESGL